jgi:glycosyltransferase involved in cell wall biosynthesis
LSNEQARLGHDSDFQFHTNSNLSRDPFGSPSTTLAAAIDQYVVKNSEFDAPVSFFRSKLQKLPGKNSFELLHLHWIQGVLNLKGLAGLESRAKSIFLTLHDLRPMTGACHYSLSCLGFKDGCSNCPAVIRPMRGPVHKVALSQRASYLRSGARLIAPSSWVAKVAEQSFITGGMEVRIIENPIDPSFFQNQPQFKGSTREIKIGIVAANLEDPVKGVVRFLDDLGMNLPESSELQVRLIGSKGGQFRKRYHFVRWLGELDKQALIRELDELDLLVIPSLSESAGMVIAEASARGVPSLGLKGSGIGDMIREDSNGHLFSTTKEMVSFILREDAGRKLQFLAPNCIAESSRWNPELAAKKHIEYYVS